MLEKLMNIEATADVLGVSVHTLYAWVSSGRLPVVKVGARSMFAPKEIERWVAERSKRENVGQDGVLAPAPPSGHRSTRHQDHPSDHPPDHPASHRRGHEARPRPEQAASGCPARVTVPATLRVSDRVSEERPTSTTAKPAQRSVPEETPAKQADES